MNAEEGSFSNDMCALLESAKRADVTLVVGGSELPAHSQILAARSTVFAAMLQNDMLEARSQRIEITDVREPIVQQMLSFIYSDRVPQLESVAAELLAAADKYHLPLLKQRCEQQLVRDLCVESAADTAGLAELYRCPEMMKAAVQFIGRHPEVLASAGWGRLLRENTEAAVEISRQLAAAVQQSTPPSPPPPAPAPPKEEPRNRSLTEEEKQVLGEKLLAAASQGQTGEVWALLELGAPVNAKDASGESALHKAVNNGHADTVKCLIDAGADVNVKNSYLNTPLHRAAYGSDEHIIWVLLAASARLDEINNAGQTALHVAASSGRVFATRALLLAGARRDVKDKNGKTPADVAAATTSALFSTRSSN